MSVHRRQNKTFPLPLTEISSASLGKFRHTHACSCDPSASNRKPACADRKPAAYVGSTLTFKILHLLFHWYFGVLTLSLLFFPTKSLISDLWLFHIKCGLFLSPALCLCSTKILQHNQQLWNTRLKINNLIESHFLYPLLHLLKTFCVG